MKDMSPDELGKLFDAYEQIRSKAKAPDPKNIIIGSAEDGTLVSLDMINKEFLWLNERIAKLREALEYVVKSYEFECAHCACHLPNAAYEAREALEADDNVK